MASIRRGIKGGLKSVRLIYIDQFFRWYVINIAIVGYQI